MMPREKTFENVGGHLKVEATVCADIPLGAPGKLAPVDLGLTHKFLVPALCCC